MTIIKVKTKTLIELLTDLEHTAEANAVLWGAMAGVLLHTARGYPDPTEPGEADILVGTSTTSVHTGHTWVQAYGQTPPMLWPIDDVRAVLSVFKPLAKKTKEHSVDIRCEAGEITVAEDPTLFGETSLKFHAGDLTKWPRDRFKVLGTRFEFRIGEIAEELGSVAARTDLDHSVLDAFRKVAKRRGAPIQLYRWHQGKPILVQIGATYRGVLMPGRRWIEDDPRAGDMPDTELYVPELPEPDEAGE